MKRYTIGLTLLFALVNTGCEDAKAETKDYDTEIAELKGQINALNEKIDAMPKTTSYECVMGSDEICTIEIPDFDPNETFSFSIIGNPLEYDAATDWTINTNRLVAMSNWGDFQIGKLIFDRSGTSSDYSGMKVIVSITK